MEGTSARPASSGGMLARWKARVATYPEPLGDPHPAPVHGRGGVLAQQPALLGRRDCKYHDWNSVTSSFQESEARILHHFPWKRLFDSHPLHIT
jgi:hypothetical protein